MNIAQATILGLAGIAACGWTIHLFRKRAGAAILGPAYLGAIAVTWAVLILKTKGYHAGRESGEHQASRPVEKPTRDYVSSDTCRSCHPGEYHSWHRSYHRTMTQLATSDSVRGDFESEFTGKLRNLEVRMKREGDTFFAEYLPGNPMGLRRTVKRDVVMTTGSHHYQVYWTAGSWIGPERAADRTVWLVPFVYHFEKQQWLPRHATFITPPTDLPEYRRWNQTCSRCHSTHGAARYRPATDTHDTRVVEFGISCESCHGPGREHIELNRNPLRRYQHHLTGNGDSSIVNPARLDHRRSAEVCGRCHSNFMSLSQEKRLQWNEEGQSFRPGDILSEHLHIHRWDQESAPDFEELDENYLESRFWSDGMARVAGREYNGLLETPCFQKGEMSCLSCHDMHQGPDDPRSELTWANDQLGPRMRTNAACIQCHETYREPAALAAHTHHLPASSGSNCYNCHMPHTSYGLLRGIRSHQIDSPSVKTTLDTGRPNACNLCHLDRTLAWTSDSLKRWYGQEMPTLNRDQEEVSASLLWLLQGDAGQRALLASAFSRKEAREISGTDWMPPFLAQLHLDPYHAIRIIANRSLRSLEGFEEISRYPRSRKAGVDARRIWEAGRPHSPTGPGLLIDAKGNLRQEEVERLLKRRDDTPVYLSE